MADNQRGIEQDEDLGLDANLDDLSLDDEDLFADLDDEMSLADEDVGQGETGQAAGAEEGEDLLGDLDDLDLSVAEDDLPDLDLSSADADLDDLEGEAPAGDDLDLESGEGDEAAAGSGGDDLDLDLDAGSSGDDLDLDLDAGGGDDLDFDLDAGGGDDDLNLDLDTGGGGGEDLDFGLALDEAETGADTGGEDDLGLEAGGGDEDLDFDLGLDEDTAGGEADAPDLDMDEGGMEAGADEAAGSDDVWAAVDEDALDLDEGLDLDIPDAPEFGDGDSDAIETAMAEEAGEQGGGAEAPVLDEEPLDLDLDMAEAPGGEDEAEELEVGDLNFEEAEGSESGDSLDLEPPGDWDVEGTAAQEGAESAAADAGLDDLSLDDDSEDIFAAAPDVNLDDLSLEDEGAADAFEAAPDVSLDDASLEEVSLDDADSAWDMPEPAGAAASWAEDDAGPGSGGGDTFEAVPDVDLDEVGFEGFDFSDGGAEGAEEADDPSGAFSADDLEGSLARGDVNEAGFDRSFEAVPDLNLSDEDVLELNVDDLESVAGPAAAAAAGAAAATAAERGHTERSLQEARTEAGAGDGQVPGPVGIERDLLLSVPRRVQVEVGSVELNGNEIMDLHYGSVVQLDQSVGEPVALTLNGKAIAHGEIVLINGKNLGVRIVSVSE